ncbi:RteC domain-containing protein [Psychroflexus aestuariivivens]|uniref:RteC domain-containing protein n=1 Tax=Psychroflexus aestuariivivens TaxID=1795040 RepID=UPI000FD8995D|nr:RteC domain-containing protein [Psychroflexus aestuariivivens]
MKYQEIIAKFSSELELILNKNNPPLIEASNVISVAKQYVFDLKTIFFVDNLNTLEQQNRYYKEIKPSITKHVYYYNKVKKLEVHLIGVSEKKREKIFMKMTKCNDYFYERHKDFIYNITYNQEFVNKNYFISNPTSKLLESSFHEDYFFDDFECIYSNIFAEYLAVEKFKTYLEIKKKQNNNHKKSINQLSQKNNWTATSTDFIEMAYALYLSNSINNGDATIKQIVNALSTAFNVKVPQDFYKTIDDIKQRKDLTKFINKLEFALKDKA